MTSSRVAILAFAAACAGTRPSPALPTENLRDKAPPPPAEVVLYANCKDSSGASFPIAAKDVLYLRSTGLSRLEVATEADAPGRQVTDCEFSRSYDWKPSKLFAACSGRLSREGSVTIVAGYGLKLVSNAGEPPALSWYQDTLASERYLLPEASSFTCSILPENIPPPQNTQKFSLTPEVALKDYKPPLDAEPPPPSDAPKEFLSVSCDVITGEQPVASPVTADFLYKNGTLYFLSAIKPEHRATALSKCAVEGLKTGPDNTLVPLYVSCSKGDQWNDPVSRVFEPKGDWVIDAATGSVSYADRVTGEFLEQALDPVSYCTVAPLSLTRPAP